MCWQLSIGMSGSSSSASWPFRYTQHLPAASGEENEGAGGGRIHLPLFQVKKEAAQSSSTGLQPIPMEENCLYSSWQDRTCCSGAGGEGEGFLLGVQQD